MSGSEYIATDRYGELDHIALDTVFKVLTATCDALLPDLEMCQVFLSRILRDPQSRTHPETNATVSRLLRKGAALGPLDPTVQTLKSKLTGDKTDIQFAAKLEGLNQSLPSHQLAIPNTPEARGQLEQELHDILARTPGHIGAASHLLLLNRLSGEPSPWLEAIRPPRSMQPAWQQRLFLHHTDCGNVDEGLSCWSEIAHGPLSEIQLNAAAELHVTTGNIVQAEQLYQASLSLDPTQGPVRDRLAQLRTPFQADTGLVDRKKVAICLYSWNKADDLEKTLRSLSRSHIGPAIIRILLNGCSDHSSQVAKRARALFPNNDIGVIELPVNIGAPAARNWIGSLPEVLACEYLAYLDDDVEMPNDWLTHFLSIMEQAPDTAVVGCKVAFGNNPKILQYLHRVFTLAEPGLIKLSQPSHIGQADTGCYDFVRTTDTVMGCCHLLRTAMLPHGPIFDIRYSPSQIDDIAHDLSLRLAGHSIRYTGLITCRHHQHTGAWAAHTVSRTQAGQVMGNDMKLYHALRPSMQRIQQIMTARNAANL